MSFPSTISAPTALATALAITLSMLCGDLPTAEAQEKAAVEVASADAPVETLPPVAAGPSLALDPVVDTAILLSAATFALTLEIVLRSGELTPQAPGPIENLPPIDRWRAKSLDVHDSGLSNFGAAATLAYALADTVLVEVLDRGDSWTSYAVVYGQSAAITLLITNVTKIAVRRPRPQAYHDVHEGISPEETDTALSFFSGHAALTAALSATAGYLVFAREASRLERALVITGGILFTGAVSALRVVEGKHFPTDVIAGATVGAAIGTIVPALHRVDASSGTSMSAFAAPALDGSAGGTIGLHGRF